MGRMACTEPQCLYSTVQYSRAIPLLPLWAVWPVQSLSACTVELYLYPAYGPYGLYRASVPVQYSYTSTPPMGRTNSTEPQCLYSRAIPLLPLWVVRPVQSLSACTRVHRSMHYDCVYVRKYIYIYIYIYTPANLLHVFGTFDFPLNTHFQTCLPCYWSMKYLRFN